MILSLKNVALIGEAHNLEDILQLCTLTRPDLVLMDLKSSLEYTKDAARQLQHNFPSLEVIALVSPREEQHLLEMPDEDLPCYFSRDISEEEFARALMQIGLGEGVASSANSGQSAGERLLPAAELGGDLLGGRTVRTSAGLVQELEMAGRIQAGILPEKEPLLPGWEISARLVAARETSGDFYDFIPVSDKNWGIVVADVADKGMGAALVMTMASTLIRNFAPRYPTLPALTFDTVNQRLLSDTRASSFVTAFIGVLEPHIGRLRYANAGHPPPLLVKSQKSKPVDHLAKTGMALGVLENFHWKQKVVILQPGDVLVFYTDGILEAQNAQGAFFDGQRLHSVVRAHASRPAAAILEAIFDDVQHFTAGTPGQDDMALVVVRRK